MFLFCLGMAKMWRCGVWNSDQKSSPDLPERSSCVPRLSSGASPPTGKNLYACCLYTALYSCIHDLYTNRDCLLSTFRIIHLKKSLGCLNTWPLYMCRQLSTYISLYMCKLSVAFTHDLYTCVGWLSVVYTHDFYTCVDLFFYTCVDCQLSTHMISITRKEVT